MYHHSVHRFRSDILIIVEMAWRIPNSFFGLPSTSKYGGGANSQRVKMINFFFAAQVLYPRAR